MSRFDHFFSRNRLKSQRRARSKQAKREKVQRESKFQIEALEPRLLLSADLVTPIVAVDPGATADTAAEVLYVENQPSAENTQTSVLVEASASADLTTEAEKSDAPNSNVVLANQGQLIDVAFNTANSEILLANNTDITRIDSDTGAVLTTFDIPGSDFTSSLGLQILPAAISSLGGTAVAAGSLLVTNGTASADKIFALDAITGDQLAVLDIAQDIDPVAGAFHAERGTLFLLDAVQDRIIEMNPEDGTIVNAFAAPIAIGTGGLAINPVTGNLWIGSNESNDLAVISPTGLLLQLVDVAQSGVGSDVSGLAFKNDFDLLVGTTQGDVIKIHDPTVSIPQTLTGTAGTTITVPINIGKDATGNDATGILAVTLGSPGVAGITYDTTLLDATNASIRLGPVLAPADSRGAPTLLPNVNDAAGTISLAYSRLDSLELAPVPGPLSGALFFIDFQIKATAPAGTTRIDLRSITLEGEIDIIVSPAPRVGPDETDGIITITAAGQTNQAPTDIALSNASVAENQPSGTTVGNLSATDPDVGDTHTFSLVAGTGSTDNASFQIVGNQLRTNAVFDFETKNSYSVRVRATDNGALFFEKAFTIDVTNVNEAPVVNDQTFSVAENSANGTVVGTIAATDVDAGTVLSYAVTGGIGQSAFSVNSSTGQITVTDSSLLNFETTPSFSLNVTVSDNGAPLLSDTALITINLTNVNERPVANNDTATTNEDTAIAIAVLANDTDPENSTLGISSVTQGANGSVVINPNGTVTYTPNANFNGQDSFTYILNDGTVVNPFLIDQFTIKRNGVTYFDDSFDNGVPPPDAPNLATGGAISYSLQGTVGPESGGKLTLDLANGVLGTGISETGSNLSLRARLLTNTNQANLTDGLKSDDTFAVTGIFDLTVPNENGTRFGIRLTDASGSAEGDDIVELVLGQRGDGRVTIQLRELDDIGNINILLEEVLLDSAHQQIALMLERPTLANNSIHASFAYVDSGVIGAFTTFANTVLIFNGENFTRAEFRARSAPSIGTVNVTVNAVNDAPVNTVPGPQTVNEDTTLVFSTANGNAISVSDVDAGTANVQVALTSTNGTLTLASLLGLTFTTGDGSVDSTMTFSGSLTAINTALNGLSYAPAANFNGSATLTITTNDQGNSGSGGPLSDTDIVNITVTAVDDAPVAVNDSYSTNEDTQLNVAVPGLLGNDTDVDSAALTAILVTGPQHGTLNLNTNGSFTYTPAANFNGSDSFTYKANDGQADSNIATVSITIDPVNDAPVANNDSYSTDEDVQINVSVPGVLGNDTDVDSATLNAVLVSDVQHGTLTLNNNGSFTYAPAANFFGSDSFTYKANDGLADSNIATVSITITAVNDAPVADNDSFATDEDTQLNVAAPGILDNDTDVDSASLIAVLVSDVQHGTLLLNTNGSFSYTPAANFNGSDSFTYKANDGIADSNIATVSITINAVDDAPIAVNDSYSTNEDTALTVAAPGVLSNDTDVDSATLNALLVSDVQHGLLTLNANGSFTYTPAANFNGSDSFTYKANDGQADSNVATVGITINAVNDAPVATDDAYTVAEGATLNVPAPGVLVNDTDVDSATLAAALLTSPQHGALTLTTNGSFTYTPAANFNGSDSFTYKANDGQTDSNIATVSITINAVNDTPVAVNDSFSTNEDTQLVVATPGVLGNDTDIDSVTLNAVLVSDVQHGTLTLNTNGSFTYTPAGNFNGSDSFTYKANDGQSDSNVATVTITINAVNDAPVANNDSFATNEDTALTVAAPGVLSNDTDVDSTTLNAVLVSDVQHGTLTLNINGSFTFTPAANFFGSDSFTYKANDGLAESNIATVSITINAVNDAPVANNDSFSTNEDTQLLVAAPGVLGNDTDIDSASLTAVLVTSPQQGSLTFNANGSFSYTPDLNFNGSDSFTYKANDGLADSNIATVNITINAVNDAPVAVNDSFATNEDTQLNVNAPGVLGNDTDIDSATLTALLVASPQHGALTLNANGSFTYTPASNFNGSDSFTYKANEGLADSNIATVNITINAVNDAPVAVNDSFATDEDTQLNVAAPGILGNDTDVDSATLNAVLVSGVQHGTLTLNTNGSFTYTPGANNFGSDSFTYNANDGQLESNVATASITINAVIDAPVAVSDSFSTNEDTQLTVAAPGVLGNDTDVDSLTLNAVLVSDVQHGQLALNANGSFIYTPASNFNGTDSFTYKANDGLADSNIATVSITINAVNDAPVANNDSFTTNEDTALTVPAPGILGNDTDVDSAALTTVLVTGPQHGTLSLNTNGSFTYTPASNFNGSDSFTYKANDGLADSNIATVSITISAVNDAPVAVNDSFSTNEDTQLTVAAPGVLVNDTDVNNATLTAVLENGPAHGALTLNANGSFTYTPASNFSVSDSFTYKANDGLADSNIATVNITINAVNDAPVAVNDSFSTNEDTQLNVNAPGVLGNDTDIDSATLTAVLVVSSQHGALTLNANGSFTYTPAANFNGSDSFTYKANDGALDSNVATVSITINAVNDAPVAVNDSFSTNEDTVLDVAAPGVLGNDTDVDSAILTAVLVTSPQHGALTLSTNGSFSYTPALNFNGSDSFTYKTNDGIADSNVATVTITVNSINDAPVANDDAFTVAEGATLNIPTPGVLANDTDIDSASLTAVLGTSPQHGSLTLNSNGSFSYTPDLNFNGSDSFTYKANDGQFDSNITTVSITINAVNDAPVANNDSFSTNEDTQLVVATPGVLGNDTDVDSATLNAVLVSDVQHGTLTLASNGSFTYTPASNFNGSDSFTYKANDGQSDSNVATVTITINAVNDAPVANNDSFATNEDTQLAVATPGVLGNDSDVDSATLTAVLVTGPQHGQLTLNTNGSFTYTPALNFNGSDSFTYKANDGLADSNVATVSITINAVNDAPVANNDSFTTNEDTALTVPAPGVLGNDTDIDSATLTAAVVTGPQHGQLTLNPNGSFTYTPAANFNGSDSFTYKANDGQADSNNATVSITINGLNDAPIAVNDSFSTNEDTELVVAAPGILGNDTDVDSAALITVLVAGPQHGQLVLNNLNGSFTYTPAANFFGSDSFTYKANDGALDSNVATVSITINSVNDAPVAVNDSFSTNEDTLLTVAAPGVLGNDTDIDSASLTAVLVNGPQHGTLSLNANGSFSYTPALNFNGSDSFTYKANDGLADANIATVSITINPVNDVPVAGNDQYSANEDALLVVATPGVLANDTDVDSSSLTAALVSAPQHGTLTLNSNGSFSYLPDLDYFGPDSFTYQASDGQLLSNVASVSINVIPSNQAPTANDDVVTTDEDTPIIINVLANDTDADGDQLAVNALTQPANGTAVINPDGTVTYTPSSDFHGTGQFTYTITDGSGEGSTATVNLTINPVNDAPLARDDAGTTSGNTPVTIDVLANDSDIDGTLDPASVAIHDGALHGTVSIDQSTGQITYTAAVGFSGADSFTYTVRDEQGAVSNLATVRIEVQASSNDVPQVSLITDPCDPSKTALQVIGTDGADKIRFVPQGNKGEIKVLINGESQGIFRPTGRIIAYGLAGNDDIEVAGSIGLPAILHGDGGNDRLKAGSGPAVLVGGAGDDLLIGGNSRNLLIGGLGADRLVGGSGDDILIGGGTQYDGDHQALCEILEEWNRSDLEYNQSVRRQSSGAYGLNSSTVVNDGAKDQIIGGAGFDWYFIDESDKLNDKHSWEIVVRQSSNDTLKR